MTPDEACNRLVQMGGYLRSDEAKKLAAVLVPAPLHILGGEPFAHIDDLERILSCAKDNLLSGEITTGAAWVEGAAQVRGLIERFAGKLHSIEVEVCGSPIDAARIEQIETLITECRRASIFISLRCSVGPSTPFPKQLFALETLNRKASFIQSVPNTALILAAEPETKAAWLLDAPPRRRCAELFNFVIVEGGDCYPCIEGVGLAALRLGSLECEPALAIMQRAMADRSCQHLRKVGPQPLFVHIQKSEASSRLAPGYVDACHFHRHILSDPVLALEASHFELERTSPSIAMEPCSQSIE